MLTVTSSWDDNSTENLRLAELLHQYEIKGTFYICADHDKFNHFNQIRKDVFKIARKGFEIGSHSLTHPDLTKTSKLYDEVYLSKIKLESYLGFRINCFSYPYGKYNLRVKRAVKKAGYQFARTINYVNISSTLKDPYICGVTIMVPFRFGLKNILSFKVSPLNVLKWEKIAISIFNKMLKHGGIFHFWGHAWSIEKHKQWKKIEKFVAYVSGRKNVEYLNNFEAWNKCLSKV